LENAIVLYKNSVKNEKQGVKTRRYLMNLGWKGDSFSPYCSRGVIRAEIAPKQSILQHDLTRTSSAGPASIRDPKQVGDTDYGGNMGVDVGESRGCEHRRVAIQRSRIKDWVEQVYFGRRGGVAGERYREDESMEMV
jgi:hypothetical protein